MDKIEIKLNKQGNFVTRYGTTLDEKEPSVIYLRTKSKITPLVRQKEYNENILKAKNEFTSFANNYLLNSDDVENAFIFNIDMSPKGVKFGKKSFLRYDVYLRPKVKNTLQANQGKMEHISLTLDENLERILKNNQIICK